MQARVLLMAVVLGGLPLRALAQEPPGDGSMLPAAAPSRSIGITPSGRYLLDGEAVSRNDLKAAVAAMPGNTSVTIQADPAAPRYATNSVLELLQREGITDVNLSMRAAEPEPAAEPAAAEPAAATSCGPAAPAWARPVGELRFGLHFTGLSSDDGPMDNSFRLLRGVFGVQADLGDRVTGRIAGNLLESRGDVEYTVTDGAGVSVGTVSVPSSTEGFIIRARDAWLLTRLDDAGKYRVQTGIQVPIFGIQPWFNDQRGGFYTSSPSFQSVGVLGGLYGVRVMGVRGDAEIGDIATVSLMASNADNFLVAEENTGKDASARAELRPSESTTLVVSGRYGFQGEENIGTRALVSVAGRYDSEVVRVMGDVIYGFDEADATDPETRSTLLGAQGAAAATIPATVPGLQSYILVGRVGFFDPDLEVDDATSWMQYNAAARVGWDTRQEAAAQTGLGVEVYVPVSLEEPVTTRVLAEVLWDF